MPSTGRLDLEVNRWEPFDYEIRFEGQDLTGATFIADVRDRKDGGFLRAGLTTVASIATEGIKLVSVATEAIDYGANIGTLSVPVSLVHIHINEPTVEAMGTATLAAGALESGDDGSIWWDMQITPSGGTKYRALEGAFNLNAGSTGSG